MGLGGQNFTLRPRAECGEQFYDFKAAISTHSPSVAGASADKIVDNKAAALLAKDQPSDLRNDKEMKDKPIVDTTTTMRA